MLLQQRPARSAVFGDLLTRQIPTSLLPRVRVTVLPVGRKDHRKGYSVEATVEPPMGAWTWSAHLHPMPVGSEEGLSGSVTETVPSLHIA